MASTDSASATRAEIDIRALVLSIVRSLPLLLLIAAVLAGTVFLVLSRLTPLYLAEARLIVEVDDVGPAVARSPLDGEVQLIRSREIALAVISELGLAAVPEYRRAAEGGGLLRALRVALGLARDLSDATEEERVLAHYGERLSVRCVDDTATIVVSFEAEDPELAARAANAVASAYLSMRRSVTAESAAMLEAEIDRLHASLSEAEHRATALRDLVAGLPAPLTEAERGTLESEARAAVEAAAAAAASAEAIRGALAAGRLPDVPAYLDDPAVRELVEEQGRLRDELAREMAGNPLGNPRVAELRGRLTAMMAELREAAERVAAGLDASADLSRSRAATLQQRLRDTDAATAAATELATVEQAASDYRSRLEAAERRRDALNEAGVFAGDIRLLARADVPASPVWPDAPFWTVVSFVGALILGGVIVAVRTIDRDGAVRRVPFEPLAEMRMPEPATARFRRVEQDDLARPPPEAPTLAPIIDRGGGSLGTVADSIAGQQRVVVTLAEDSDSGGRPLVAVALARALAGRDHSVVLLDFRDDGADALALGETPSLPGFADLLAGRVSFSQVIFRDRRSRAHFISAGAEPVRPEALAGERLATLLAALDHTYDHVVIDCPDEAVARIAPGADAALVASEHASADPRTVRAVSRVARASDARIFHLKVEPGRRPSDPDRPAEAA